MKREGEERKEEEIKKKTIEIKKSSREVGNLGQRRKSSKIIGRSEEVGSRTIL